MKAVPTVVRSPMMPRATKRDAFRVECRTKLVHELFDGVLYEKPLDSVRALLTIELGLWFGRYLDENDIGFMLESQATLALRRGVIVSPDFSVVLWDQCSGRKVPWEWAPRLVPAVAVDIRGPSSTPERITRRHCEYFLAGVAIVWVIDPKTRAADVYTAPGAKTAVPPTGALDGGDVLPGFRLTLTKLFERLEKPAAQRPRKK
jgi:Uma2 family endonuclease